MVCGRPTDGGIGDGLMCARRWASCSKGRTSAPQVVGTGAAVLIGTRIVRRLSILKEQTFLKKDIVKRLCGRDVKEIDCRWYEVAQTIADQNHI